EGGVGMLFLELQLRRNALEVACELDVLDRRRLCPGDRQVAPGTVKLPRPNAQLRTGDVEVDGRDSGQQPRRLDAGQHLGRLRVPAEQDQLARGVDRQEGA